MCQLNPLLPNQSECFSRYLSWRTFIAQSIITIAQFWLVLIVFCWSCFSASRFTERTIWAFHSKISVPVWSRIADRLDVHCRKGSKIDLELCLRLHLGHFADFDTRYSFLCVDGSISPGSRGLVCHLKRTCGNDQDIKLLLDYGERDNWSLSSVFHS